MIGCTVDWSDFMNTQECTAIESRNVNSFLCKLTFREDLSHPEVAGGEPDDGGLVQLAGDGGGQRQQLAQLEELGVLLLATVARRVLALVLLGHRETETASDISGTLTDKRSGRIVESVLRGCVQYQRYPLTN